LAVDAAVPRGSAEISPHGVCRNDKKKDGALVEMTLKAPLDNFDFSFGEIIQFVDQPVNPGIDRLDPVGIGCNHKPFLESLLIPG
jgi:hypothetical protein